MVEQKKIDMRQLRRDFAQRFDRLIGDDKNEKNIENFARKSGIAPRQASQWRNPDQVNWPSAKTLIQICWRLNVSPTWLLFGIGPETLDAARKLRIVALAGGITHAALGKDTSSAQPRGTTGGKK